jgi:hypothetical protein
MLEPRYPMSQRARRRCFRGLIKICGEYGILPNSYLIPGSKVQKLGDTPVSSSDFSHVWPGMYNEAGDEDEDGGKCVAIKVVRYFESEDIRTVKKVRSFDLSPSHRASLTVCRTFAERSSPGSVCPIRTCWC